MDQRSQIVLNDDNTGPTAVGNHSHAGLHIKGIDQKKKRIAASYLTTVFYR
jgi:hypothetical protein